MTYCLALDHDVLQRLRSEILEQVGQTRYPDVDDIRQMKYLRAVINGKIIFLPEYSTISFHASVRNTQAIPSSAWKCKVGAMNKPSRARPRGYTITRTAIRSTTLPASTPGEKPFYIPANTKSVQPECRLNLILNLLDTECHTSRFIFIGARNTGDLTQKMYVLS